MKHVRVSIIIWRCPSNRLWFVLDYQGSEPLPNNLPVPRRTNRWVSTVSCGCCPHQKREFWQNRFLAVNCCSHLAIAISSEYNRAAYDRTAVIVHQPVFWILGIKHQWNRINCYYWSLLIIGFHLPWFSRLTRHWIYWLWQVIIFNKLTYYDVKYIGHILIDHYIKYMG